MVKNKEIRERITRSGLKYFEVAEILNISTYTFSKWLQRELPHEKKDIILSAIETYLDVEKDK